MPNRTTLERALIAERGLHEVRKAGKKLAKDVLEEFMLAFGAMAARAQPRPGNEQNANPREFEKWAKLAVATAARLAPFQSPTFRAIIITDPMTAATGAVPGAPVVMPKDAELLDFPTDALGMARVYRQLVDGGFLPASQLPPGARNCPLAIERRPGRGDAGGCRREVNSGCSAEATGTRAAEASMSLSRALRVTPCSALAARGITLRGLT